MNVSRLIATLFLGSVIAGAVMLAMDAITPKTLMARDRSQTVEPAGSVDAPAHDALETPDSSDDHTLSVQLWTLVAAGSAMGLGLVLFLVRIALGRVSPPPPPQEDTRH